MYDMLSAPVLPISAFRNLLPHSLSKKIERAIITPAEAPEYLLGGEMEDDETDLLASIPPHDSINPIELLYTYTPEAEAPCAGSSVHILIERQGAGWANLTCALESPLAAGEVTPKTLAMIAGKIFPRSAYDGEITPLRTQDPKRETPLYLFAITSLCINGDTPLSILNEREAAIPAKLYVMFSQLAHSTLCSIEVDPDLENKIPKISYKKTFHLPLKQHAPTRAALLEAFA